MMQKISKKYYYSKYGERKINCYTVNISKDTLQRANIKETDNLDVRVEKDKIIIEKIK